jgi:hypothetical protein
MSVQSFSPSRRVARRACLLAVAGLAAGATSVAARGPSGRTSAEAATARVAAEGHSSPTATGAGMFLGGLTSQSWPFVIQPSKNGKAVRFAAAGLEMTCTSGDQFGVPDGWAHLPISRNGAVHISGAVQPSPGSTVSITGGNDSFTGRFNRARTEFSGVWDLHLNYSMSNGQTDSCDSGQVKVAAVL